MGKSAPKSPDPIKTAQAQSQYNMQAAQQQFGLNAINQSGPYGSTSYNQIGTWEDGTPRYEQITNLNANQQGLLDASTQAQTGIANLANTAAGQLGGMVGNPYQSNAGQLQTGVNLATTYAGADDFSADRDAYTQALLARNAGNRTQNEAQLRTTLANKGIREGSAAWNAEMERMGRQNTDEQYAALLAGGQEQARMVGLANQAAQFGNDATLQQAGFGNNALAQQDAMNLASKGQNFNQMAGLLGGANYTAQNPTAGYGATPQTGVNSVDYSNLVNQNYQNQLNSYNAKLGGIGGLFGTVMGGPIGGAIAGRLF